MKVLTESIKRIIIPDKLIYKDEMYRIIDLHSKFIINEIEIKTVNKKIDLIKVRSPHPNVNPVNRNLCFPHRMRSLCLTKNTIIMIESILRCFNLDNCYFTPWDEIEYTK
jgi:hypothetical protein